MNVSLDSCIQEVINNHDRFLISEILSIFAAYVPKYSAGRKAALDIIINLTFSNELGSTSKVLSRVEDEHIFKELSERILATKGMKDMSMGDDLESSKMLISDFINARDIRGDVKVGVLHWERDKCQFHLHTELGLPCYAAKEKEKQSQEDYGTPWRIHMRSTHIGVLDELLGRMRFILL